MVHTNARPPHHEDLPPSRARRDPQFDQRDAFEHGDVAFAAAGGVVYRKALAEGSNKVIPTEWLGSDLSAYYEAGFRPSP